MALLQLYKACRDCECKDACDNKRMERLGMLSPDIFNKPLEDRVNIRILLCLEDYIERSENNE